MAPTFPPKSFISTFFYTLRQTESANSKQTVLRTYTHSLLSWAVIEVPHGMEKFAAKVHEMQQNHYIFSLQSFDYAETKLTNTKTVNVLATPLVIWELNLIVADETMFYL